MPKKYSEAENKPEIRTPQDLLHANLTNDFLFGEVFGDPLIACKTAECILHRFLGPAEYVRTQVPHNFLYGYRGMRDDVEVMLETHDVVDLEMQAVNKHDDAPRTQFYGSHLDCFSIKSGEKDFRNAKKVTIIYFTNYDPFGHGDMVYETMYTLKGYNGELSDRIKVFFVNLKYRKKSQAKENPDLAHLINYIRNSNGIDCHCELTRLVSEKTMAVKTDHQEGIDFMIWSAKNFMDKMATCRDIVDERCEMRQKLFHALSSQGKMEQYIRATMDNVYFEELYKLYCGPLPAHEHDDFLAKYSEKFQAMFSEFYETFAGDNEKILELYQAYTDEDCEAAMQKLYNKYITNKE